MGDVYGGTTVTFGEWLTALLWVSVVAVFGTVLFYLVKAWIKR